MSEEEADAIQKYIADESQVPDLSRFSPVSLAIGFGPSISKS